MLHRDIPRTQDRNSYLSYKTRIMIGAVFTCFLLSLLTTIIYTLVKNYKNRDYSRLILRDLQIYSTVWICIGILLATAAIVKLCKPIEPHESSSYSMPCTRMDGHERDVPPPIYQEEALELTTFTNRGVNLEPPSYESIA